MSHSPLQPPAPFADFEFTFDPSLSNLFPNPPPLPSSADLFSPAETTDLLGFLDNFNDFAWDLSAPTNDYQLNYDYPSTSVAPYSNPHLKTVPDPSTSSRRKASNRAGSTRGTQRISDDRQSEYESRNSSMPQNALSDSSTATTPTYTSPIDTSTSSFSISSTNSPSTANRPSSRASSVSRPKPLLSSPQKRLNHIMSEQKRRNAIRDGYAQLIALLAPAGSAPGIGMPTRGRPKGSGSQGKGISKGKSGVLFRAVEYCRWLEEGRDSLREEVIRVEAAAGIQHDSP